MVRIIPTSKPHSESTNISCYRRQGQVAPSFRPIGAVDPSLRIHLLSADLLWTRVQPRLVSRPEREKLEISCMAKWAYNHFVNRPPLNMIDVLIKSLL